LEDDSLSLRHMTAHPYTFDGQQQRLSLEATMNHGSGWRGRVLRIVLIAVLGLSVASMLVLMAMQVLGRG
jgi:hypothetical protein